MRRAVLLVALLLAACGPATAGPVASPIPSGTVAGATATPAPSVAPSVAPSPPAPTPSPALTFAGHVVAEGGARIRQGPGLDQAIVGLQLTGTAEVFDGWYRRADDIAQVDGLSGRVEAWSRDWYRLADGRGWMHATTVDSRPPAGLDPVAWTPPPPPVIPDTDRQVVVSITKQHLWAVDNGKVIVDTVVATGRPELTTVTGRFSILHKYSPYTFISPWPRSSPYWYPDSPVSYAMEFESTGFFLHDAPWRTDWGPGANLTSGTHGCVNVPLDAMKKLYEWARVGDVVVVEA